MSVISGGPVPIRKRGGCKSSAVANSAGCGGASPSSCCLPNARRAPPPGGRRGHRSARRPARTRIPSRPRGHPWPLRRVLGTGLQPAPDLADGLFEGGQGQQIVEAGAGTRPSPAAPPSPDHLAVTLRAFALLAPLPFPLAGGLDALTAATVSSHVSPWPGGRAGESPQRAGRSGLGQGVGYFVLDVGPSGHTWCPRDRGVAASNETGRRCQRSGPSW